jgi:integrase
MAPGPPGLRITATLAAGCGLRQGEVFALAVDDVDFLRRFVQVRRQVMLVRGAYVFALPKGEKAREVPLLSRSRWRWRRTCRRSRRGR